jgi:hypothetical protein
MGGRGRNFKNFSRPGDRALTFSPVHNGKRVTLAEDYDPPAPWQHFYFRLAGRPTAASAAGFPIRYEQKLVSRLTDQELAWIARVVLAEVRSRYLERFTDAGAAS